MRIKLDKNVMLRNAIFLLVNAFFALTALSPITGLKSIRQANGANPN
jgi:hypothetical protein